MSKDFQLCFLLKFEMSDDLDDKKGEFFINPIKTGGGLEARLNFEVM